MTHPRSRGRRALRHLAAPALALAVVATLPLATGRTSAPATAGPGALAPVAVSYAASTGGEIRGNLLSYNDFHGAIDPRVAAARWSTALRPAAWNTSPPG
ncbi:hypothetical protein GCM10027614_59280 [Micromonospora vulcania]